MPSSGLCGCTAQIHADTIQKGGVGRGYIRKRGKFKFKEKDREIGRAQSHKAP